MSVRLPAMAWQKLHIRLFDSTFTPNKLWNRTRGRFGLSLSTMLLNTNYEGLEDLKKDEFKG